MNYHMYKNEKLWKICKAQTDADLIEVRSLITSEDLEHGGLLRPIDTEKLWKITLSGGSVWAARNHVHEIICCFTCEEIAGSTGTWIYLNNGIVRPDFRHTGGMCMKQTIATAMTKLGYNQNYIVIYLGRSIFQELGYREVSIVTLSSLDHEIGKVIGKKLRPETKPHIFIRLGQ